MKISREIIRIEEEEEIIAIVYSNINKNRIYGITKDLLLLKIDVKQRKAISKDKIKLKSIEPKKKVKIQLSSDDRYMTIVNASGQFGYVYDLSQQRVIFDLDRKNYHSEQSFFPLCFFTKDKKTYLIHGTNWNHLDITELSTRKTITQRHNNKYGEKFYLDYFYGELHLSPNKQWLLSSGWIWGPASVIKFINLDNWFTTNRNKPEVSCNSDFGIMNYYWDRALCWVNNHTIAYLYDPKEEELDDEDYDELNFQKDKSYILLYDLVQATIVKRIEFAGYPRNEYHEATPDCRLFFNKKIFFSSRLNGLLAIDPDTGVVIYQNDEIYIDNFNQTFEIFYNLKENNRIELVW